MKKKCSICYTTIRINSHNGICYQCHLNLSLNSDQFSQDLAEKRSREILKKENENFEHFLETGEVKPLHAPTPGGEAFKYEPSLIIKIIKQRAS